MAAHDKTNKMTCALSEDSDQPWHMPSLIRVFAVCVKNTGSWSAHWVHNEGSDQSGRMPRLIWVFAGRTCHLLVLSCDHASTNPSAHTSTQHYARTRISSAASVHTSPTILLFSPRASCTHVSGVWTGPVLQPAVSVYRHTSHPSWVVGLTGTNWKAIVQLFRSVAGANVQNKVEGVSAKTWLTPFLIKSELMLYWDTSYQDLNSDI